MHIAIAGKHGAFPLGLRSATEKADLNVWWQLSGILLDDDASAAIVPDDWVQECHLLKTQIYICGYEHVVQALQNHRDVHSSSPSCKCGPSGPFISSRPSQKKSSRRDACHRHEVGCRASMRVCTMGHSRKLGNAGTRSHTLHLPTAGTRMHMQALFSITSGILLCSAGNMRALSQPGYETQSPAAMRPSTSKTT